MFVQIIKGVLGLFFIPVVISLTKVFFKSLGNLDFLNVNSYLLIIGFFVYPIFHIVFFKPTYIYALGHEIVHVLATWLCGGKVTSFRISQNGGNITTTKDNLFIRLSPYFVPIHAIFLFLLYRILSKFYDISGFSDEFIVLMGFTLGFHLIMTVEVMKTRQPDILKTGYLFSVLFIYAANITIALLALSFISQDVSFIGIIKETFILSKDIYFSIFSGLLT